jgi:hypothetical protein
MQAYRQNGDQDVFGEEDGDNAGNGPEREKPPGDEDRDRRQDDLPEPKVYSFQRTFIADCGRRQRRQYGSHESIIVTESSVAKPFFLGTRR